MNEKKEKTFLYNRVLLDLKIRRNRILEGKINCIPWGLERLENELPGIEQGKYYLITANSKVGKTQIADWLFLYNVIYNNLNKPNMPKVKIFYFTLEMSKEEKLRRAISNLLYIKENIRIAPKDLRSTKKENVLSEEILELIEKNKDFIKKIEETVIFIDSISHPTGIYNFMKAYAGEHGVQHTKTVLIGGVATEVDDYYEAYDPEQYVMILIDHIGLITEDTDKSGKQLNLHQSISKLSSKFLIKLRNKYRYIPIIIQQQAAAQESLDNLKAKLVKPSLNGLADNKLTQRDADVIIGLYSPFRFKVEEYPEPDGYDITYFRDNIRFLEILGGREGGEGTICPLFFDGKVNYFEELPLPNKDLTQVLKKIKRIRTEK